MKKIEEILFQKIQESEDKQDLKNLTGDEIAQN